MLDSHSTITGIRPLIFGIPSYSIFVTLGMVLGLGYYLLSAKRKNLQLVPALKLVCAALFSALIGAKIPLLFLNPGLINLLVGKSIVGGLLGGMVGVMVAKRIFKIQVRLGNIIAPAIALGIAVGRIGCFFNGCCYGTPASWGFDFGDGQLRLPTQLFEVLFHFCAFLVLAYLQKRVKAPGILFKWYVLIYFLFRFFMEYIRETPGLWLGMTIYQIISLLGILYMAVTILKINKEGASS